MCFRHVVARKFVLTAGFHSVTMLSATFMLVTRRAQRSLRDSDLRFCEGRQRPRTVGGTRQESDYEITSSCVSVDTPSLVVTKYHNVRVVNKSHTYAHRSRRRPRPLHFLCGCFWYVVYVVIMCMMCVRECRSCVLGICVCCLCLFDWDECEFHV